MNWDEYPSEDQTSNRNSRKRKANNDDEEHSQEEINAEDHQFYANKLGSTSGALENYSLMQLQQIYHKLQKEEISSSLLYVIEGEDRFFEICRELKLTTKQALLLNSIRKKTSKSFLSSQISLESSSSQSPTSTPSRTSSDCNSSPNTETQKRPKKRKPESQTVDFWKQGELLKTAPTWGEKLKSIKLCKVGNGTVVVLGPTFRPVCQSTYDLFSGSVANFLALLLCATITEQYIKETYGLQNPTADKIDEIALSIVPSFAYSSSKRAYGSEDSTGPSVSCRKNGRDFFLVPPSVLEVVKAAIGFKGTTLEFEACLGWLQSKSIVFNNVSKLFISGQASPFSYSNYKRDMENMESLNSKLLHPPQNATLQSNTSSSLLEFI